MKNLSQLIVDSYILEYYKDSGYEVVTIQATKYNETGEPILWSIKSWRDSMSKKDGCFQPEPLNSSKTKNFCEYLFVGCFRIDAFSSGPSGLSFQ